MFVEYRIIQPNKYGYDNSEMRKWGVFVDDKCIVTTDSEELAEEFKKRADKYINNKETPPFESEYLNNIVNMMFKTINKYKKNI